MNNKHNKLKSRQRGISFVGLIFVGAVVASVGIVLAQVAPTAVEYQAAVKAINKAKDGNSVADVRTIFDKAAEIDNITAIAGKDLVVEKNGDKVIVSFAYDKEIALFGPAYLLIKYSSRTK